MNKQRVVHWAHMQHSSNHNTQNHPVVNKIDSNWNKYGIWRINMQKEEHIWTNVLEYVRTNDMNNSNSNNHRFPHCHGDWEQTTPWTCCHWKWQLRAGRSWTEPAYKEKTSSPAKPDANQSNLIREHGNIEIPWISYCGMIHIFD